MDPQLPFDAAETTEGSASWPGVFDVAVIGGGPSGAIAAEWLAQRGRSILLVDPGDRIKPCGGAIPCRTLDDFAISPEMLVARANAARVIAPSGRAVEMRIGTAGYVGMVDRATFDPYLRERAAQAGAIRCTGRLETIAETADGLLALTLAPSRHATRGHAPIEARARLVIGADGANSAVRRLMFSPADKPRYVFAYHEIIETPASPDAVSFKVDRCDVIYDGRISPDFYGWIFPHGGQVSIGCGSGVKGHDLRRATGALREAAGLEHARTIRREGAPLPLKPMRRWDNGRNVVLAGDAAGTVAPSSGEGIYYALQCGVLAAEAVDMCLRSGKPAALRTARKRFMKAHGRVFFILGILQAFWYRSDRMREKFVTMCADPDVQRLTWESYLDKRITRRDPLAHLRVFLRDVRQLLIPAARQK